MTKLEQRAYDRLRRDIAQERQAWQALTAKLGDLLDAVGEIAFCLEHGQPVAEGVLDEVATAYQQFRAAQEE